MQHKLTKGPLLDDKGRLVEAGYAYSLVKDYERAKIKKSKLRIKEWDYYYLGNSDVGIAVTVADNGYMGLLSVTVLDLKLRTYTTKSKTLILPLGRLNLPKTSERGTVNVDKKGFSVHIVTEEGEKRIVVKIQKFKADKTLELTALLKDEPRDSMVIATPFKGKPYHFYYNQKVLGYEVEGTLKIGDDVTSLSKMQGLLDFGRGVWPYKNKWYWGACMGYADNKVFAFNIGYGFGDTSRASENMVFIDGIAHKLGEIVFNIPRSAEGKMAFMKPWIITSSDKRFELMFTPVLDRTDTISLGVLKSDQHQVFGHFSGTIILDNKEEVTIENILGFAEVIANKW